MAFARLKGEQLQMCAGIALSVAYPPRLVVAKTPTVAGRWCFEISARDRIARCGGVCARPI
jgi:hypothetical protein